MYTKQLLSEEEGGSDQRVPRCLPCPAVPRIQCTVYVQFTVYSTVYSVQYSLQCTVHISEYSTVYSVQYNVQYTVQFPVYSTVYSVQYNIQCTVQFPVYSTVHNTAAGHLLNIGLPGGGGGMVSVAPDLN